MRVGVLITHATAQDGSLDLGIQIRSVQGQCQLINRMKQGSGKTFFTVREILCKSELVGVMRGQYGLSKKMF